MSSEFYQPIGQAPDAAWTWVQNSIRVIARSRTGDPATLRPVFASSIDPARALRDA